MIMKRLSAVGLLAGLCLLQGCDFGGKQIESTPDDTAAVREDVRKSLDAYKKDVDASGGISPAAQNINPFRSSFALVERETFDDLLAEASQDEGYLDRSLALTLESLDELPMVIAPDVYETALTCAAYMDAAARQGDYSVYEAQRAGTYLIDQAIGKDAPERELLTEEGRRIGRSFVEERVANFRKRTYLNYQLMRMQFSENAGEIDFATRIAECQENPVIDLASMPEYEPGLGPPMPE